MSSHFDGNLRFVRRPVFEHAVRDVQQQVGTAHSLQKRRRLLRVAQDDRFEGEKAEIAAFLRFTQDRLIKGIGLLAKTGKSWRVGGAI